MTSIERIKSIQQTLAEGGFYDGAIDGKAGPITRQAFDDCAKAALHEFAAPPPPVVTPPLDSDSLGLQMNAWPLEADAAAFFGYPSSLTHVDVPFPMDTDDGLGSVRRVTCNIKVAASLRRIFNAIHLHYNGDIGAMRRDGVNYFDGIYNDRNVRGSSGKRSMHAYAAAIDIDAAHNPLGATTGRMPRAVVDIFKAEGWRWGGDYQGRKDWMHFEACR